MTINLPQILTKAESTAKQAKPLSRDILTRSGRKGTKQVLSPSIHPSSSSPMLANPAQHGRKYCKPYGRELLHSPPVHIRLQTFLQSQLHSNSLTWVQTHGKERKVNLKFSGNSVQGASHSTVKIDPFLLPRSEVLC